MSDLTFLTPLQLRRARFRSCLFLRNKESTGLRCAHPSLWTMFQLSWILEYLVKQPQPISKSTQILSLGLSFWEWTTSASWGLKGGQEMTLYRRGCGWSSDVYMIVWRKSQEWKEKGVGHRSSEELWGVRILNLNLAFPDAREEYLSGLNYRIYLIVCRFGSQLLNVWVYIVVGLHECTSSRCWKWDSLVHLLQALSQERRIPGNRNHRDLSLSLCVCLQQ